MKASLTAAFLMLLVPSIKAQPDSVSFVDKSHGFRLSSSDPAAGLMSKQVYGTEDGGRHWRLLNPQPAHACYPTGIAFRSPLEGWITAVYHGGDDIPLYRTVDGGKSWRLQRLLVPVEYRGGYGDTFPPTFTGTDKERGRLPVTLVRHNPKPGHIARVTYETNDGGATWQLPATSLHSTPDE